MKITLELSDNVIAGFFNYVYIEHERTIKMHTQSIATDEMHDGAVIKIGRDNDEN